MINPYTKKLITNNKSLKKLIMLYIKHYRKEGGKEQLQSLNDNQQNKQNNYCPICLQKIIKQNGGSIRESLQCSHIYHKECLQKIGENNPCVICDKKTIFMNYEI